MALAGREVELKLRIAPRDAARIAALPQVRAMRRAPARTMHLLSVYFDTADHSLARAELALRLRREKGRWIQTLKGPAESGSGAGMASRREFDLARGRANLPPALDATQFDATPWAPLLAAATAQGLRPQFATDFRRTTVPIALPDGSRASVSLDVGEVRDGRGHASDIAEMEVELDDGRLAALYGFVEAVSDDVPLAIETRSKAQRGYDLRAGDRRRPATATHPPIGPDDPADAALATLLRACARQIADNADGTLHADDPEWIHQLRIGTRRLRSCLALLRGCIPAERHALVAGDAQWLARALGPARDLDVLIDATLPDVRAELDARDRRVVGAFDSRAQRARVEARAAARIAVASPRFTRLLLGAGALAATPRLGAVPRSASARTLAQPVPAFATPWLARRHRKLVRMARRLREATAEERHEVRLAAKRLRYVAEFFADAFPGARAKAYRKALARLQDALGTQVDAQIAVRLAYAIEGASSPAARVLEAHVERHAHAAARQLQKRWRAFRDCPRYFAH